MTRSLIFLRPLSKITNKNVRKTRMKANVKLNSFLESTLHNLSFDMLHKYEKKISKKLKN